MKETLPIPLQGITDSSWSSRILTVMEPLLDRWHGHLFTTLHQRSLLYNACWEDPALDREALDLGPSDTVVVITSGGCNALDYVLAGAGQVRAVDVNPRQNALLDLKLAAARSLDYEDYWQLFGVGRHGAFPALYHGQLRPRLPEASRAIWDQQMSWFHPDGGGLYLRGMSGAIARGFRSWMAINPGLRRGVQDLLAAPSLEAQREAYDRQVSPALWTGLVPWALGRRWFLCLCGVPGSQRAEIERSGTDVVGFIRASLDRVFRDIHLSSNYFYQVYLRGSYTPTCCPTYLTPAGWSALRAGGAARITTHTSTVSEHLARHEAPVSRFVLLDHLDWLGDRRPDQLTDEWEWILRRAGPSARAIWRSAHPEPSWMHAGRRADGRPLSDSWLLDRDLATRLHARDRVGTYGGFHIAHLNPHLHPQP